MARARSEVVARCCGRERRRRKHSLRGAHSNEGALRTEPWRTCRAIHGRLQWVRNEAEPTPAQSWCLPGWSRASPSPLTDPQITALTGRRRTTRHRLSESDARATLRDPVRVESSLLVIDPRPHGTGWRFASGLVRRDDGAMMQPDPRGGTFGGTSGSSFP